MKYVAHLFVLLALSTSVVAQDIDQKLHVDKAHHGLSSNAKAMPAKPQTRAQQMAVIWTDDISDCSTWTFGNGSDEVNQPWADIDLNFECSTVGSSGFYNQWAGGDADGTPAPGMNSTTGDNGFLLVDSDLYGAEVQYDAAYIENSWAQTAQPINLADHPYVTMTFETRYRCWDNGASDGSEKCFIEISRDGTSWPTLTSSYVETWDQEGIVVYGEDSVQCRYEVFPESETNFQTENPSILDFDISPAAGGQETVWIRFRWVGTWGYAWEIDDIEVYDTPRFDVRIDNYASSTNYLQTGWYENGTWALSQIPSYLEAGAKVYNVGYKYQTNVAINLDVNGTVFTSDTIDVLAYQANDTIRMPYQPTMLGDYTLTYQLFADSTDENPGNNTLTQSFSVTEFQYGRDNGEIQSAWPPVDNSLVDYMAMPLYDIHNDVTIYGVDVAVMDGAEPAEVRGMLMDMDFAGGLPPADQYFGTLIESEVVELATDYTNAADAEEITWITLAFEEPYQATAGQRVGAVFESFGGYNVQVAEAQLVEDGTAWYYGPFGANQTYGWYFTNNVPMVRLNLDPNAQPSVILGCTNVDACNYVPSANEDNGSCILVGDACDDGNENTGNDTINGACECLGIGCTDEQACNYEPMAATDDGSCSYDCYGCTDPEAFNFDVNHTIEDGSCSYFVESCEFIGNEAWSGVDIGVHASDSLVHMFAVDVVQDVVLNLPETIQEPVSGALFNVMTWSDFSVSGMPQGLEFAALPNSMNAGEQVCLTYSGLPVETGVFDVELMGDMVLGLFGNPYPIGPFSVNFTVNVLGNPNPIEGCTYANASNFLNYANLDDGSCFFAGCMNPEANNFQLFATTDDGSCVFTPCVQDCPSDLDGDGSVGTSDLLALLSSFGFLCAD